MSELQQDGVTTPDSTRAPVSRTTGKPADQGQSFRVGNKIIRIDAASIETPPEPHLTPELRSTPEPTTSAPTTGHWSDIIGVIDTNDVMEMGLGDIAENNLAMQQAAREMARLHASPTSSGKTAGMPQIKPAWEVDYFRWPRLSRRLLKMHRELFDQIGNQLLKDLQPTRSRIGVCSTFSREGKTTIATCLARWSARTGRRTLLIDADVERPRMTVMCGLDCTFGWQSILDADIPASETMIRSMESGLIFMPSRSGSLPVITDKAIDRLSTITFQMKYEFDVVVVDMGTIDNICAHGNEGMDVVDAMLVTRDPSRTSVGQMMDTRRVLNNLGISKTYVAQNFARRDVA